RPNNNCSLNNNNNNNINNTNNTNNTNNNNTNNNNNHNRNNNLCNNRSICSNKIVISRNKQLNCLCRRNPVINIPFMNRLFRSSNQSYPRMETLRTGERLIHMLALKPYKRPELVVKLQQDGVRKEEMKCTQQILKTISSTRDGVLILHRNIWNEVQDDWPFYSEQDRQAIKRRRPQNLTPPLSSDGGSSTSGQSPSSTHNGNSPQSGSKRAVLAGGEEVGSTPTAKKQRISHYKKDTNPDHTRPNLTPNAQESEDGVSLSYSLVSNDVAKRIESSVCDAEAEREPFDTGYLDGAQQMNGRGEDDFVNQFTRITSVEQRRRYKTEFDNEYKEYRRLHEVLENASRKFAQYEDDLLHEPKDTQRYKEIQMKILKEYEKSIKNVKFQQDKERFNYLHKKLSHIKLLVRDYDTSITNGSCRPQENY
uniref:OCEL domain-containing protein n=1 Tax=Anopheles christyi TaxID=43041 RepID=A0A182JXX5_9DIPT